MAIPRFQPYNPVLLDDATLAEIGTIRRLDVSKLNSVEPRLRRYLKASLAVFLLPQIGASKIRFDPQRGVYIKPDGRIARPDELREILGHLRDDCSRRLEAITVRFLNQEISLAEWERLIAEELKTCHMAAGAFGFGGIAATAASAQGNNLWGILGRAFRDALILFGIFAAAIAIQSKTPRQILAYARHLSKTVRGAYERSRQFMMKNLGFNEARRFLDSLAQHCPDCVGYETLEWTSIDSVVPVGVDCICNGNCRCRMQYRFNPARVAAG